nr:hypothetical protein [uncultured Desulfobacter sp.]
MTVSGYDSKKPHGLFLNQAKAQCSIYESGRMAYECLKSSNLYLIDYQEIDQNNLPLKTYDFYLFNYHHITMSWLDTDFIRQLPGKKFTLVLETLPGDPFVLCPSDLFDAYLALDPTMYRPDDPRVYAFPRPLEDLPDLPQLFQIQEIPIIGTFGFATPGKGFERVVDAVNKEFDKAIIKINIPSATYADGATYFLHNTSYASYLEQLCRKVAKPGVEIQVTNSFMSKEQLIRWCAENTLNCFLYHRDQPGLAATTDQAITSGRPLAVSANPTFRHIHAYLNPYPFQSLRESLQSSLASVKMMQKDWAQIEFTKKFEGVLSDLAFIKSTPKSQNTLKKNQPIPPQKKVLVVSHKAVQCGIHQYGINIVKALQESSCYAFEHVLCASPDELDHAIQTTDPQVIIYNYYPYTMPWLTPKITRRYTMPCLGMMHEVTQEEADAATADMFDFHLCPDPTLLLHSPYILKTKRLIPDYINTESMPSNPVIGSFGFGFPNKGFERLVSQVQEEFDNAVVRLHLTFNELVDKQGEHHTLATAERCKNIITKPGIRLEISHHFMEKKDLLDFLAGNTINAFLYDDDRHRGISSVVEHALAVERPIAVSRCGMFRHVLNTTPSICIEDNSLRQIISNGIAPLVPFYNEWSKASFIMDYERILDQVLGVQHQSQIKDQKKTTIPVVSN